MSRRSRRLSRRFKKRYTRLRRASLAMRLEAAGQTLTAQQKSQIIDVSRHIPLSLVPLHLGTLRRRTRQSEYLQKLLMEGWDSHVDKNNEEAARVRADDEREASGDLPDGEQGGARAGDGVQVDTGASPPGSNQGGAEAP